MPRVMRTNGMPFPWFPPRARNAFPVRRVRVYPELPPEVLKTASAPAPIFVSRPLRRTSLPTLDAPAPLEPLQEPMTAFPLRPPYRLLIGSR
jgi:hypothetical protein